jgi:hypothetical protein
MARPRPIIIPGAGLSQTIEPSVDTSGLEILGQALNLRREREARQFQQEQERNNLLSAIGGTVPQAEKLPTDILSGLAQTQAEGQVAGAPLAQGLLTKLAKPGFEDIAAEQAALTAEPGVEPMVTEDQILQQAIANIPITERVFVEQLAQSTEGRDILKKQFAEKEGKEQSLPEPLRISLSTKFGVDIPAGTTFGQATSIGLKVDEPVPLELLKATELDELFPSGVTYDNLSQTGIDIDKLLLTDAAKQEQKDAAQRIVNKDARDATSALFKEFEGLADVKAFRKVKTNVDNMNASFETALKSGDFSVVDEVIITNLKKILDPGSVVRESEYDRTPQGQALVNRLEGMLENAIDQRGGAGIGMQLRQEIVDQGNLIAEGFKESFDERVDFFANRANKSGVNPELVVTEIFQDNKRDRRIAELEGKAAQ